MSVTESSARPRLQAISSKEVKAIRAIVSWQHQISLYTWNDLGKNRYGNTTLGEVLVILRSHQEGK